MSAFAEKEEKNKKTEKTPAPTVNETVQRDLEAVNGPEGGMLPGEVSAKIQSKRGYGSPLSSRQLDHFSKKFGRDMSDVRVHTDTESDTISRSLNARAFTIGSDVFLTKGINPDGGGRDAQTMTHELTHVVQQGGHASSGPLKLGAADTAQEHEAESTAMREFDPKLKEDETEVQREYEPKLKSSNTIQRGFWGDLGSAIGRSALGMLGIGEAMDDFMTGDKKVRAAINKMPRVRKENYLLVENSIKHFEKNEIPRSDKEIEQAQSQLNAARNENDRNAATALLMQKLQENENLKGMLQGRLDEQFNMLQEVDATITKEDIDRYRSGKAKTFFSSVFSSIGGNILGAFESDPEKKAAVKEKSRNSINNWFASKNKQSTNLGETEEDKARKALELKDKQNNLIESVWNEVQNDPALSQRYTKLLLKREIAAKHMTMIQESLKENEPENDIKASLIMLLRNSAQKSAAAGAAPKQGGENPPNAA